MERYILKKILITSFLFFFFLMNSANNSSAAGLEEGVVFQGDDGDKNSLITAIENSLNYLELKTSTLKNEEELTNKASLIPSYQKRQKTLQRLLKIIKDDLSERAFAQVINKEFFFQEVSKEGILLTGYFEPIFWGSFKKDAEFQYPLYRPPDDLVGITKGINKEKKFGMIVKGRFVPYYSREEIDKKGILKGKGYEILWLKDPWERFLLHVQGSGRIKLPDGQIYAVKYAASNGRPYRSIGQYLVKKGFIEEHELSLRKVKEFFQKNPHLLEEFLNINERYIFFRAQPITAEGLKGPEGALDFPLTPGRSIATDHSFYPPGGLCYLMSTLPVLDRFGQVTGRKKINRFVLNQDKGAAMKGASRVDLFIGSGPEAELLAGEMKEEGRIFILRIK